MQQPLHEFSKIIHLIGEPILDLACGATSSTPQASILITREKSNSAATISSANLIDPTDPRNEGIESEHFVSPSYGEAPRPITYTDPADGTTRLPHQRNENPRPPARRHLQAALGY